MITFASFYKQIKQLAVPEGVGANVLDAFRNYVVTGLIRTQTYIPCLKDKNVDFYVKAETKTFCNVDIINGPRGVIEALYVFKPGKDCAKFFYNPATPARINCWIDEQRCQCDATDPISTAVYDSPYCNYIMDGQAACAAPYMDVPEDDAVFTDCTERIFAKGPDNKLYLAPRFPCGHVVAVHSNGIKRSYRDTDAIVEDDDLKNAVATYAESKLAEKDRDLVSSRELMKSYDEMIRDMAHRCRQEMRTPVKQDCAELAGNLLPFVDPTGQSAYQTDDQSNPCVYCP